MTFMQNAWYCAAWPDEVSRTPVVKTILGRPIVFFRTQDGEAVALDDTCPHRFAPLHLGVIRGDCIECPYHGVQFGSTGECALNPHTDLIPPALKVRAYPLVERHGAMWIWPGDSGSADPSLIHDCGHHRDPQFETVFGYVHVDGHYELINDNLLDLTHVRFLHKSFQAPYSGAIETDVSQSGNSVTFVHNIRNSEKSEMHALKWPDGPDRIDALSSIRWDAPSNLLLKSCNTGAGQEEDAGIFSYASHLITPETETSSHYFWSFSRNFRLRDDDFAQVLRASLETAIRDDDAAMIARVQDRMGTSDLMALHPVILPTDGAAVRARRITAKLIREEQGGRPARRSARPPEPDSAAPGRPATIRA